MHEEWIPIVMFVVTGVVVIGYFYLTYLKRQLLSKEIRSAIEHGVDVPFPDPPKKNYLLPGIIWTLLGLISAAGIGLSIPADAPQGVWVWGLIPCALGVGYLAAFYIDTKKKEE